MSTLQEHLARERRGRTIAVRSKDRPLLTFLGHLVPSAPRPVKRFARWCARPRVAIPVLSVLVALIGIAIYYTVQFSAAIDARLNNGALDDSIGLYSAPLQVSVGDRLPPADLAAYLEAAGYQAKPRGAQAPDDARYYSVEGTSVEVHPDRISTSESAANPLRIQVDSSGRVVRLTRLPGGESLKSATLEGEILASLRGADRRKKIAVRYADIPAQLRAAIVAIEDRRFFSHNGIDWRGIVRAAWADVRHNEVAQGGSTITQQLIKNAFLSGERTVSRKLKEAAMAVILESRLSKEEIFTLYCNDVYLGQSGSFAVSGFAQAARAYFNKDLNQLSLGESAFLAGLIRAPNRYSPLNHLDSALDRRNTVLAAMADTGDITAVQAEAARREPLNLKQPEARADNGMSYFVDYAERCIDERYGARLTGGTRVVTTIDWRLQQVANKAVQLGTARVDRVAGRSAKPVQAALVALDAHNGEVLAMIGGRSYDQSQLNRATDARRQPGSSFKPFVYAAAIESRRFTTASLLSDRPQTFTYDGGRSEYTPTNFHGGFSYRDVTVRDALAHSMNVPAVAVALTVGLGNVAGVAEDCGLNVPNVYPSMALGTNEETPLEMAGAYTAFANGGMAVRPTPVKSVSQADKPIGTTLTASRAAFSPQVAYLMTSMMESVVETGTAARMRGFGVQGAVAGKTGTTNDGWFIGYTPNLVVAVWVGYDDNSDLNMKASDVALPIWADFVRQATEIRPDLGGDQFSRPSGIVEVEIDPTTGLRATPECPEHRLELFMAGAEPGECTHGLPASTAETQAPGDGEQQKEESDGMVRVVVCEESGMLASSSCPHPVSRLFLAGDEPKQVCDLDHSPDGEAAPDSKPRDEDRQRRRPPQ